MIIGFDKLIYALKAFRNFKEFNIYRHCNFSSSIYKQTLPECRADGRHFLSARVVGQTISLCVLHTGAFLSGQVVWFSARPGHNRRASRFKAVNVVVTEPSTIFIYTVNPSTLCTATLWAIVIKHSLQKRKMLSAVCHCQIASVIRAALGASLGPC